MRDFLYEDSRTMKYIENVTRELARLYGYEEVITPIVESYELLAAKAGEEIRQRMYVFEDLGGRKVALRPEFTASIARLMATTLRNQPKPLRLFCFGSLYRYDEPQFGRFREFWQSNYELVGSAKPEADAEILLLTTDLMERLGFKNYTLKIGHIGILRGVFAEEGIQEEQQNRLLQLIDKQQFEDALKTVQEYKASQKCLKTLKEIFETKGKDTTEVIKKAQKIVKDYEQAENSLENLRQIIELIKESKEKGDIYVDVGFARGLEYYTGAIYEVLVPELQISVGGGGRYDKLVELFGGEPTPAVGVAHGIDRLMLAMEKQKIKPKIHEEKRVAIIPVNEELKIQALKLAKELRNAGISVEMEVMGRTVSRTLQDADRRGISHAVIIGPEEFKTGKVVLRDMKKREQKIVSLKTLKRILTREQF
jgi:histidyl-tRNA synthetase